MSWTTLIALRQIVGVHNAAEESALPSANRKG
jgi:hypothetical protein